MRTRADSISQFRSAAERKAVNQALDRGAAWREISTICQRHGRPGVTQQNVSNYRKSPERKRWNTERAQLAAIRAESSLTADILRAYTDTGGSPAEAGVLTAAEILTGILRDYNPTALKTVLADKPEKILDIISSIDRLARFVTTDRKDRKTEPATQTADPITPDKLKAIFGITN